MLSEENSRKSEKRTTILFWIFTGLFAAFMLSSAIPNILVTAEWEAIFAQLGYPHYLIVFIGTAKLLGVIVLLVPRFPRLKEWAYAGFFFDLVGVTYSAISVNGFMPQMLGMLIPFILGGLSYIYHHKKSEAAIK
jgi:hypothetical protein